MALTADAAGDSLAIKLVELRNFATVLLLFWSKTMNQSR